MFEEHCMHCAFTLVGHELQTSGLVDDAKKPTEQVIQVGKAYPVAQTSQDDEDEH